MISHFKANKGDFLTVDKYGAKWTKQDKQSSVTFTKATHKQTVNFRLSNFFKFWNNVFQQIIGTPMGLFFSALFFVSLSPYYCENKWINKSRKQKSEGALEMFLDSLTTWLHSMIAVSLKEAYTKFIPLD